MLITNDSDLTEAIRLTKAKHPKKTFRTDLSSQPKSFHPTTQTSGFLCSHTHFFSAQLPATRSHSRHESAQARKLVGPRRSEIPQQAQRNPGFAPAQGQRDHHLAGIEQPGPGLAVVVGVARLQLQREILAQRLLAPRADRPRGEAAVMLERLPGDGRRGRLRPRAWKRSSPAAIRLRPAPPREKRSCPNRPRLRARRAGVRTTSARRTAIRPPRPGSAASC